MATNGHPDTRALRQALRLGSGQAQGERFLSDHAEPFDKVAVRPELVEGDGHSPQDRLFEARQDPQRFLLVLPIPKGRARGMAMTIQAAMHGATCLPLAERRTAAADRRLDPAATPLLSYPPIRSTLRVASNGRPDTRSDLGFGSEHARAVRRQDPQGRPPTPTRSYSAALN